MTKFRPKPAHFESKSQVCPNKIIFHNGLTEPAKILILALNGIFTCTQNWVPCQQDLQGRLGWGELKMRNAIKSGVKNGYLKVIKPRDENGLYTPNEFEYDIDGGYSVTYVEKEPENDEKKPSHNDYQPDGGYPSVDDPGVEEQGLPCSKTDTMFKETTTCFVAVLLDVEIDDYEKEWLSQNYDEETIADAIAYAKHPTTKIRTNLTATLKWACNKRIKAPLSKEESFEKNKIAAQNVKDNCNIPEKVNFEILNKTVEFNHSGSQMCDVLEYSENGFWEMFLELLKKYRITPK